MPRRVVILCALLGCAPSARTGPTSPVGAPTPASAVARADSASGPGERGREEAASKPPPPREGDPSEGAPGGASDASAPGHAVPADPAAPADPAVPADPAAPTAPGPAPVAEPDPVPVVIADAAVPKLARLGFSPRSLGKQRVRLRHAGTLYAPSSLAPLTDDGDGHWLLKEVRVLDGDATGHPRRPRVLCENEASRLGVAVDAEDLATTVRTTAFVGPRPTPPKRLTPQTPGVRLAGGSEVSVRGGSIDGATEITYDGLLLVVEGFVASEAIDVVYTPGELEDDGRRNGKLRRNVRFLDAPGGIEIARTERAPGISNEMHVLRLGPVQDDHVLVRYQEHESFVVGWVPSEDVERYPTQRLRGGGGGGSGSGGGGERIELARGTRLVPTNSTEVIGVVTKTHRAHCVLDCKRPNPHVRIRACSRMLTLRAVP